MTWNYRVVKQTHDTHAGDEILFQIHEVYYDDDGNITAMTKDPVPLTSEGVEGLKEVLGQVLGAFDKPILDHGATGNPL